MVGRVVERNEAKKIALLEEVEGLEKSVADLKALHKATPRHVLYADLPEKNRFKQLGMKSRYLIDAIKMIAYRAKTAMVNTLRPGIRCKDDVRVGIELNSTRSGVL